MPVLTMPYPKGYIPACAFSSPRSTEIGSIGSRIEPAGPGFKCVSIGLCTVIRASIVIFMPIFVPLLPKFGVDPLFFGLLVALNLQTAFLSPPVAMSAFYLKGVAPKHVTLNQIFAGMLPFMGIQVLAIFLLYMFPQIGLWLPQVLYGR